jgi:hypothetical protein
MCVCGAGLGASKVSPIIDYLPSVGMAHDHIAACRAPISRSTYIIYIYRARGAFSLHLHTSVRLRHFFY